MGDPPGRRIVYARQQAVRTDCLFFEQAHRPEDARCIGGVFKPVHRVRIFGPDVAGLDRSGTIAATFSHAVLLNAKQWPIVHMHKGKRRLSRRRLPSLRGRSCLALVPCHSGTPKLDLNFI
jgi:hypothetical protein